MGPGGTTGRPVVQERNDSTLSQGGFPSAAFLICWGLAGKFSPASSLSGLPVSSLPSWFQFLPSLPLPSWVRGSDLFCPVIALGEDGVSAEGPLSLGSESSPAQAKGRNVATPASGLGATESQVGWGQKEFTIQGHAAVVTSLLCGDELQSLQPREDSAQVSTPSHSHRGSNVDSVPRPCKHFHLSEPQWTHANSCRTHDT